MSNSTTTTAPAALPPGSPPALTPFMRATLVLHGAALALLLWQPSLWPWPVAALVLNHVLIVSAVLRPRSGWLGANVTRLPPASAARGEVALTIDDGPDPAVTPAVLDLLDAAGQRATFFCIADRVRAHPALAREIVARGHSLQNHSASHQHTFSLLGPRGYARELHQAQQVVQQHAGTTPHYFRAPAGFRNPFLAPVLRRQGLALVSWTRRGFDTREGDAARVLARLTHRLAAGDILLLHDGNAARTPAGRPVLLDVLPPLFQRLQAQGLRSVTLPQAFASES